ncbi:hypothetical protein V1478_015867 [Vespula squamosa]|uniref:Uncharacterized protein n=1 Tax=Vespula squamosa TaxID=30214 RepID=A0ABD2A2S7_VESSQ
MQKIDVKDVALVFSLGSRPFPYHHGKIVGSSLVCTKGSSTGLARKTSYLEKDQDLDIPQAEVFIGTRGAASAYTSTLQAPVRVRRVVPANHRIERRPWDVVEFRVFVLEYSYSEESRNFTLLPRMVSTVCRTDPKTPTIPSFLDICPLFEMSE